MKAFARKIFSLFFFLGFLLPIILPAQKATADSLKLLIANSEDTTRISLLLKLSQAYLNYSPRKALDPAAEARTLAVQTGNDILEARSLQTLGYAQTRTGNYKDGITCLDMSAKIFGRLGMNIEKVKVMLQIGDAYMGQGDFDKVLDNSLKTYRLSDSINDVNGKIGALISSGNIYLEMKNYNKSIIDLEKALSIAKDAGLKNKEANCLISISNVYGDNGQNEKSLDYLNQALAIFESMNDKFGQGKVLNNIGTVYLNDTSGKKLDVSSDYFLRALAIEKQIGDQRGMAISLVNLGSVSETQKNYDKAIDYYSRGIEIAKNIGSLDLQITMNQWLSDVYAEKNDYQKSLEFYKKSTALKDSLFSENLSGSIAEMQAKYGVEKAESETRAQQKQKKLITIFSFIGGMLFLIIVFILLNRAAVRKRTNIRLNQQKTEIENKNIEIELKNKDITDSIMYARRIQEAILPEVEFAATFRDSAFVLYRPKDIVSGDFYWMAQSGDHVLFAAVDCTGHGVPGAFVSIVCSNLLTQSVKEHQLIRPDEILNDVNVRLSETLRQRQDTSRVRDGMDIALCCLNKKSLKLTYAGAYNPAWIFHEKEFVELTPDKFPVGLFEEEELRKFNYKEIQLAKGDRIYVFSDGYSDQFGGEFGKKYKRSSFCEFVKNFQSQPINKHGTLLDKEHLRWKGDGEQIDDILVLGMEV